MLKAVEIVAYTVVRGRGLVVYSVARSSKFVARFMNSKRNTEHRILETGYPTLPLRLSADKQTQGLRRASRKPDTGG